jgi:hypothetical protein
MATLRVFPRLTLITEWNPREILSWKTFGSQNLPKTDYF